MRIVRIEMQSWAAVGAAPNVANKAISDFKVDK